MPVDDPFLETAPPPRGRRTPAATRAALVEAARSEFAACGFEGGRVDRIAAAAGVNKQLVYHHFGSKDDLYRAVLEGVYADIRSREQELELEALEPVAAMERLVGFSFDYLAAHPEFIALVNDENRMDGRHLREADELARMHSPLLQMIERSLERGIAEGAFHDRYDATNLYLSIAALGYFYFSNAATLSAIFGRDFAAPEAVRARRSHVVDVVVSSLRASQPTG